MIVISRALVLSRTAYDQDAPVIGWRNIVNVGNIVADSEAAGCPATNLANPATHLIWRSGASGTQYLTVTTGTLEDIDYVGIARHNFGSEGIAVSVEGKLDDGNSPAEPYETLVDEFIPPDDGPLILRFEPDPRTHVRLKLQAGSEIPEAAVVYVGKLLQMERKLYQGHTPIKHARKTKATNGRSESGNFLGRIVTTEWNESNASFSLITPAWLRANLIDFLTTGKDLPFFFAWRPESYPYEVGYAWLTNDPMPTPASPHSLLDVELAMSGII